MCIDVEIGNKYKLWGFACCGCLDSVWFVNWVDVKLEASLTCQRGSK